MELHQIRYFVSVARMLHFTRAAEACSVSQPALTRAIQRLEAELGGSLFHRDRANTQLTELGHLVLPAMQKALDAAAEAKMLAEAFHRREVSPLRIGLEYSIPQTILTPMLASLRRRGTDIELTLSQMSQQDLYARMLNGETDLALLVDDDDLPERLHRWKMFHERYLLVCPPGHRFGDRDRVPVRELAGESLLMHEDSLCQARRFLVRLLEQANIRPHRRHFANNLEQILEMARAALGVSVAGERAVAPPPLFRRGIETEDDARTVVLTAVAGRPLGPTPALFVRLMRAHAWNQPPTETAGEA